MFSIAPKKDKIEFVLSDKVLRLDFEFNNINKNFSDVISVEKTDRYYKVKRKIKNVSCGMANLYELKTEIVFDFSKDSASDYYYSCENMRLFSTYTLPVDFDRTLKNIENNAEFNINIDTKYADYYAINERILSAPYLQFPAVLVSNYQTEAGIVFGSLSQKVFYHNYEITHKNNKISVCLFSSFKGIEYREVLPGEELIDYFYVGYTETAGDINEIFDAYTQELRKEILDCEGSKTTNRHTLIWDSWNDGIYRDVNESMLLDEAKAYKKYFKNAEWFQLDDGYSAYCEKNVDLDSHGIGVVYEGEGGIDHNKFPGGLKDYTDKIKDLGLKPAVWIGGLCPHKTEIYLKHPEWFIDFSYRIDSSSPLDVSFDESREYMQTAIKTFISDYGFEGVKHDFWSYAFEEKNNILSHNVKSGYEYRTWWLSFLRGVLGENGYIGVACDLSQGNPFLGKYINNYRFGLDICSGMWDRVLTTMSWAVSVLSTHSGDLCIPNSDSIGLLPGLNDTDFMFVVNFQIITRSLVEISGRFSLVDENNPRLKVLQRATQFLNNGENVYFAKYDYRKKSTSVPEIIYIKSAFDCDSEDYITVALFNAGEKDKEIFFNCEDIGLSDNEHDTELVWQNEKQVLKEFKLKLFPHQSLLLKIKK